MIVGRGGWRRRLACRLSAIVLIFWIIGCAGVVGVLSGAMGIEILGRYRHTHIIPSVAALPAPLEKDFRLPSIA